MADDDIIDLVGSDSDSDDSSVQVLDGPPPPRPRPVAALSSSGVVAAAAAMDVDTSNSDDETRSHQRVGRLQQNSGRYKLHNNQAKILVYEVYDSSDDDDEEDADYEGDDEAQVDNNGPKNEDKEKEEQVKSMDMDGAAREDPMKEEVVETPNDAGNASDLLEPMSTATTAAMADNYKYDSDSSQTSWSCGVSEFDSSDDEFSYQLEMILEFRQCPMPKTLYWDRLRALDRDAKQAGIPLKVYTQQRYTEWKLQRQERVALQKQQAEKLQLAEAAAAALTADDMQVDASETIGRITAMSAKEPAKKQRNSPAVVGKPKKVKRNELRGLTDALSQPPKDPYSRTASLRTSPPKQEPDVAKMANRKPKPAKTKKSKRTEDIEDFVEPSYKTVDIDIAKKDSYAKVDHLCRTYLDPESSLPVMLMTVHKRDCDKILYDLRVVVKPSTIPNGGSGAFLEFLGARRLSRNAIERGRYHMKSYEPRIHMEVLSAISGTGFGVTIKLTGESLGQGASDYVHKLHQSPPPKVDGGIGLLGMFTEADYEPAPGELFETDGSTLNLGVYGPFRKQDRLTNEIYTLKNHIFSEGPAEYAFGVPEDIYPSNLCHLDEDRNKYTSIADDEAFVQEQLIDITDEFGQPHEIARKNVPMYVNECSPRISYEGRAKLKNVFVVDRDGRCIEYHVYLPYTLKSGEEVELFTEYGASYDDMRDRQGYGPKLGLRPDSHFPSRLERDNATREHIRAIVEKTDSLPVLTELLVFVHEVWELLNGLQQLDNRLIIAMGRVQWLVGIFETKLKTLEHALGVMPHSKERPGSLERYHKLAVQFCQAMIQAILVARPTEFYSAKLPTAMETIMTETQEQVLMEVSRVLVWPCEESVWTKTGATLLQQLALGIAKWKLQLADADSTVAEAYDCIGDALKSLSAGENFTFESGLREFDVATFDMDEHVNSVRRVLKEKQHGPDDRRLCNCLTPKALTAKAIGDDNTLAINNAQLWDSLFVMAPASENHNGDYKAMASAPQLYTGKDMKPNLLWYKVWQIGFPAAIMLDKYFKIPSVTRSHTQRIAARLGIDYSMLLLARKQGMMKSMIELENVSLLEVAASNNNTPDEIKLKDGTDIGKIASSSRKTSRKQIRLVSKQRSNGPPESYNGRPTKPLIYHGQSMEWPPGWIEKQFVRQGGQSAGHVDYYWFTPKLKHKLRSMVHVQGFLDALQRHGGDERRAWNSRFGV